MQISGMLEPSKNFFVDDSVLNVKGAKSMNWQAWLFDEEDTTDVSELQIAGKVKSLEGERVSAQMQILALIYPAHRTPSSLEAILSFVESRTNSIASPKSCSSKNRCMSSH